MLLWFCTIFCLKNLYVFQNLFPRHLNVSPKAKFLTNWPQIRLGKESQSSQNNKDVCVILNHVIKIKQNKINFFVVRWVLYLISPTVQIFLNFTLPLVTKSIHNVIAENVLEWTMHWLRFSVNSYPYYGLWVLSGSMAADSNKMQSLL